MKFLDNFENLKIISDILCFGFCTLLRWLFFMTLGVKFHFFSRQKRVKLLSRLSQVTALQHREEHCPTTGKPNISPTGAKASGHTVEDCSREVGSRAGRKEALVGRDGNTRLKALRHTKS